MTEPPALRDGIQLAKVREYLIRLSKSVTHPEEGSQFSFQTIRRNRDDGSIEYQIFADTKDGTQIAWVQSTRYDAEFIAACLAQAPLFAALLAASPAVPTSPEPEGWQPISTVPRDRRWVVVCDEVENYAVYRFGDGLISQDDDPQWTHWMPLPAAPEPKLSEELESFRVRLAAQMQDLSPEAAKVLRDGAWDLYEGLPVASPDPDARASLEAARQQLREDPQWVRPLLDESIRMIQGRIDYWKTKGKWFGSDSDPTVACVVANLDWSLHFLRDLRDPPPALLRSMADAPAVPHAPEGKPPQPPCSFMRWERRQHQPCAEVFPGNHAEWCGRCLLQLPASAVSLPAPPEPEKD